MFWSTEKSEKQDEKIAADQAEIIERLSDRRFLFRLLRFCIAANLIIWLGVIFLPDFVYEGFGRVLDFSNKLAMIIFGFPFGLGLYIAYCLLRLKFPDIENNKDLESEMMASFNYQSNSTKRWFIWLFSIVAGVSNVVMLILINLTLSKNI